MHLGIVHIGSRGVPPAEDPVVEPRGAPVDFASLHLGTTRNGAFPDVVGIDLNDRILFPDDWQAGVYINLVAIDVCLNCQTYKLPGELSAAGGEIALRGGPEVADVGVIARELHHGIVSIGGEDRVFGRVVYYLGHFGADIHLTAAADPA